MASLLLTIVFLISAIHAADIGTYDYTLSPAIASSQITQSNSTANSSSSYKIDSIIYDSPFNLTSQHPVYTLTLASSQPTSQNTQTSSLIFATPPTEKELGVKNGTDISSWETCAVIFRRVTDAATKRGESEDGGCFPTLGERCIDAIYAQVTQNTTPQPGLPGTVQTGFPGCGRLVTEVPAECADAIPGGITDVLTVDLNPRSFNNPGSPIPLLTTTSETHSPSNTSYYSDFSHRIWPVLMYQSAGNSGGESGVKSAATKQMRCLRDKKAESSTGTITTSSTPKPTSSDKPSMGTKSGGFNGWVRVVSGVIGGLMIVI